MSSPSDADDDSTDARSGDVISSPSALDDDSTDALSADVMSRPSDPDDANTDAASSYAVVNGRVGYRWSDAGTTVDLFARVDNAFDRTYAGSVIVNEGNGRFFEPAPGRKGLVGATVSFVLR